MKKFDIAVIGLGYVGLPLFLELKKKFKTIAYDIDSKKTESLKKKFKLSNSVLLDKENLKKLNQSNTYIVTVPTPIKKNTQPDLSYLKKATNLISKYINKGDVVVYESTVYPGVTEGFCAPIIEKNSKLKFNKDFFCAYSPERINPGDKKHTLSKIKKIVASNNSTTLKNISYLYSKIIKAGIYKINDIKTAEAAKVIENTQRDINIAFVNELSIIFNKLGLNTKNVINAAGTKWNFSKYYPGLVGGHCIGIDPYYLSFIAKKNNYKSKIILAGRYMNESMVKYIYDNFIKIIKLKKINPLNAKVLIMGITFKENIDDFRNSKSIELFLMLKKKFKNTYFYDPLVDENLINKKYKTSMIKNLNLKKFDGIILSVPHNIFINMGLKKIKSLLKNKSVFIDLKNVFKSSDSDFNL